MAAPKSAMLVTEQIFRLAMEYRDCYISDVYLERLLLFFIPTKCHIMEPLCADHISPPWADI